MTYNYTWTNTLYLLLAKTGGYANDNIFDILQNTEKKKREIVILSL